MTVVKVIGAALLVASTVQVASAAEHHERRHRAPAIVQEQFRDTNPYYAPPADIYAGPAEFAVSPYGWLEEQDEAAMTSGIAGH